eukprot:CAMPEP_0117004476 /NCGR_PEP_ID=MMETSP0472-20121206/5430_1 /TAXON_ID=693140 ORGANISM="Tiarina fusus, Strain LIS" /NCGR_SAMPLE_ID=MMETSP0472 /ASSEMBLY_ACC=CAM_ASM_000603 /LENGTH=247 /DNA_ID=CAMNT_0004705431 /DNA_START=63 /DNA_END=803 /DNA_ORIENTATION=+
MPPAPGQEEPLKRMTKIVNSLLARQDCSPFREPVDWRGLELYDYPEVITKMMDLGTVKRRLERNMYQTAHQVADDIRLIWSNCMTYNADGSDFWLLAKSYSRRFEDRYRKVKQEFDVGEDLDPDGAKSNSKSSNKSSKSSGGKDSGTPTGAQSSSSSTPSGTPSLDARATFGTNLFLLSGMELGHVITTLEIECPEVLETWGEQKVEVVVDSIPANVFSSLNSYIVSKVGNKTLPDSPDVDDISGSR